MSPLEMFRLAMLWLSISSAAAQMGCNNVPAQVSLCWVRDDVKHRIIWIAPEGTRLEVLKPVIPVTPAPKPKYPKK
jgi:hypothetical protein